METGTKTLGMWCWHDHHDTLVELLTEPLETRIAYIKREKPEQEQATRLRLIHIVKDQDSVNFAYEARSIGSSKADEAFLVGWNNVNGRYKVLESVIEAHKEAKKNLKEAWNAVILPLHAKECPDCPWDGKTIFPAGRE